MHKRKKLMLIISIPLFVIIYLITYGNIAIRKLDERWEEFFSVTPVDISIDAPEYFLNYIQYNELANKYKIAISKNDYLNAVNDEKVFEIYKKIYDITPYPQSHSDVTTYGWKQGSKREWLELDGKIYQITHDFDFNLKHFTFRVYISKWTIEIEEYILGE